jgi:hypothetical protein
MFNDLKGLFKADAVEFAHFYKIKKNKRVKTASSYRIKIYSLNRNKILEVNWEVLNGS